MGYNEQIATSGVGVFTAIMIITGLLVTVGILLIIFMPQSTIVRWVKQELGIASTTMEDSIFDAELIESVDGEQNQIKSEDLEAPDNTKF